MPRPCSTSSLLLAAPLIRTCSPPLRAPPWVVAQVARPLARPAESPRRTVLLEGDERPSAGVRTDDARSAGRRRAPEIAKASTALSSRRRPRADRLQGFVRLIDCRRPRNSTSRNGGRPPAPVAILSARKGTKLWKRVGPSLRIRRPSQVLPRSSRRSRRSRSSRSLTAQLIGRAGSLWHREREQLPAVARVERQSGSDVRRARRTSIAGGGSSSLARRPRSLSAFRGRSCPESNA